MGAAIVRDEGTQLFFRRHDDATMQLFASTLAAGALLAGSVSAVNKTGDVLNGVPVIHDLNLADVPARAISRYYLRVGELNGGLAVHIPIMVARGTPESLQTGQKLSLSAAIHGDELNPVRVVQRIFAQLEGQVATLNGTGMVHFFPEKYRFCTNRHSDWHTNCQSIGNLPQPAQLLHGWRERLLDQCEPRVPWHIRSSWWYRTSTACIQYLELRLG